MAGDDERIQRLLEEIRDVQREHLAEYRRAVKQSLELQQQAVTRQEQLGGIYRRIVFLGGGMVAILMALLVYLLVRWSPYIFR